MDDRPPDSSPATAEQGGHGLPAESGSGAEPLRRDPADVTDQRGSENFPVALRVLPAGPRRHLQAIYGYARFVDDLGDAAPGDRLRLLDAVAADLDRLYAGDRPELPIVAALAPTVRACDLPAQPLRDLIEANRVDQRVTRYPTWDDLAAYCALSANPVGRLVLQVAGVPTEDRVARSDQVCTALQVVEHLQDIGEDYRAGRVYLPQSDLAEFGVAESDLGGAVATTELRRLVACEARRASALLDAGRPLVASLRGWARLAVAGYVAGGRAAVAAIAGGGFDPLRQPARPRRRRVVVETLRLLPARTARATRTTVRRPA
jgi:squalene synthase HpnC